MGARMADAHPRVLHEYKHWILDSTRWEDFTPRDDDIVIATPYKCGTTWMQLIVGSLIYQERSIHDTLAEVGYHSLSPWLDMARAPVEETLAALEEQERRRKFDEQRPPPAGPTGGPPGGPPLGGLGGGAPGRPPDDQRQP